MRIQRRRYAESISTEVDRPGGDRALAERGWERAIPWLLAAFLLASLAGLVHPWYDATADGSIYVLTSRALLAGEGYTLFGEPFHARPPGYALLIAPILALRGTDFHALNLFTSLCGVAAAMLFFALRRRTLGTVTAALLALVLWSNPTFQRLCNQVMSDVPGLALLFGCLWLERWADRGSSRWRDVLLGVAIAVGASVRTLDVLLAPAIVLARWLRRGELGPRRFALAQFPLLAALAIAMAPAQLSSSKAPQRVPLDQVELYSYWTGMFHADVSDPGSRLLGPGEVLARVPRDAPRILTALGSRLQRGDREASDAWVGASMLACAAYMVLRRRASEDFFLLGALAVLIVFYDFTVRTVLPVYALALGSTTEVAARLAQRWLGVRWGRAAVCAGLAALALCDFRGRANWPAIEERHRRFAEVAREVRLRVGPERNLASGLGSHLAVFLERPVYSLYWAFHREPTDGTIRELFERYAIDHVVLTSFENTDRPLVAPLERFPHESAGRWATAYDVR